MSERLRIAVVGCGAIALQSHLPAIQNIREVELVAVVDRDVAWAGKVATRFGAHAYFDDHKALFGLVDAVIIATPNAYHAEQACDFLAQGVHVLCEKPMATSVAQCERIIQCATDSSAKLLVGHTLRFARHLGLLKQMMTRGLFGTIEMLGASLGSKYGSWPPRTDFRRVRSIAGGGVVMDLGVHLIDLVLWLTARFPSVIHFTASTALGWEVETDANILLDVGDGLFAGLCVSYSRRLDNSLILRGKDGWARLQIYDLSTLTFFSRNARACQLASAITLAVPPSDPFVDQLLHFCRVIKRDCLPQVSGKTGADVISVVETCYELLGHSGGSLFVHHDGNRWNSHIFA